MANSISAQHTPAHDIVIAMRNEVQADAERTFGELSFLWKHAEDLDLTDSEDRAIFRGRVGDRLRYTTVEAMRGWVPSAPHDRFGAARAVADAFIAKAQGGNHG